MPVHLVGENIEKAQSHYHAESGKLLQLMRGVYVDADDDIEATLTRQAVRIARYLYPRAYLSAASAVLLGPTRDGRLYISGMRNQRTRLRGLEIIQNQAPAHPSTGPAIIDDGMGEFRIRVSSVRQRFLEAFRQRSEHATSVTEEMRETLAVRLAGEYGTTPFIADAVWALARENEWYREGERAERFLLRRPSPMPLRNAAAADLQIAWHGNPVGQLSHDGFEWRWTPVETAFPALIRNVTPGKLPPFVAALLPEGWLETILHERDERTMLRSGERYLSNVTIVDRNTAIATPPPDVLLAPLDLYTKSGIFTGTYAGPGRTDIASSFENNLAQIFGRADTPRLSGVQIKAPMYLDAAGVLSPATGKPFTHIFKPAGTAGFEALPVIEWLALELGRGAGFAVPATALIPMPDDMPPALLIERFDIRENAGDRRLIALEDFCAILELPKEAKYDSSMEKVARAVRTLSTDLHEDLILLLRRAFFAWLIADGDMHLKNIALLKIAEPGDTQFRSVRIAPLYDAVTTRVFPGLTKDRMALPLNGKADNLRRKDFRAFAATAGLKTSQADATMESLLGAMNEAVARIALPKSLTTHRGTRALVQRMLDLIHDRLSRATIAR